jgi:broad-specificity NMP kinase
VKRVLITGLSGTGKSTVTGALATRGYHAIDADASSWSAWVAVTHAVEAPDSAAEERGIWRTHDWLWRADRIHRLLATAEGELLFVSGCAPNMRQFYPQFEHIILLSAPVQVLRERLSTRTTNAYGKHPDELARVLRQLQSVEPQLRRIASLEVDSSAPLDQVIDSLLAHVRR